MRFAVQLDLTEPIVAYQGGLIRAMPAASRIARWEGRPGEGVPPVGRLLRHRPLPGAVARDAVEWSRAHGLDPHANHLERFILRADDPRAEDYSAFMGAQAELVPDLAAAMTHPMTKVLSVSEAPVPVSLLEAARRDFAGRADVTISHPRFLEFVAPGVSKGVALAWLARRARVPLGADDGGRRSSNDLEMLADGGPWRGDAQRAGGGPAGGPLSRAARERRRRRPDDRGPVLAEPRRAAAAAERLAAEALEARRSAALAPDPAPEPADRHEPADTADARVPATTAGR